MTTPPQIWFVYRSHYEGPLSKRVRRLSAPSIVAWFKAQLEEARTSLSPKDVGEAEIGGRVNGFGSLFEAAKTQSLHTPKTTVALRKMLREHLHVEGGEDNLKLDDHTLRVLTDDDKVKLAYFFFDDDAAQKHADRVAFLLHDDPRLPDGDADGPFTPPVEVPALSPKGSGEGATYACLLTFHDGESIPGKAAVFPGVRLPELAAHLRKVVPDSKQAAASADELETWPVELRLLRAMLDEGDGSLAPALGRAAAYPLGGVAAKNHSTLGVGEHADARAEFLAAAEGLKHGGDPSKSIVHEGAHVAVLCAHTSERFGYQQWILFDDRWAAAHPDLAASILHYSHGWDPFRAHARPQGAGLAPTGEGGAEGCAEGEAPGQGARREGGCRDEARGWLEERRRGAHRGGRSALSHERALPRG